MSQHLTVISGKREEGQNGREESRTTCCSPEPDSRAFPAKGDLLLIFLLQVVEKGQVNTQQLPKSKESLGNFECAWKREEKGPLGKSESPDPSQARGPQGVYVFPETRG